MSPSAAKTRNLALCLAALYTIGSSTYLAQRVAVTGFPPLRMVGLRFAIAGSLLYAALRLRGARAPSARQWAVAAISAVPLLCLGMGGIALAVQRMPSGLAALVYGSVPLWTVIFDRLWGGRLARVEVAGIFVGAVGVALVSLRGGLRADTTTACILLVGAAGHALGFVLTRRLPIAGGPIGTASQMVSGGAILLLASLLAGEHAPAPSRACVLALAYVIVFGSMLCYSALGYVLRNARPALASSHSYVNPAVALVLGATLGDERFTRADVLGLGLVLGAVALVAMGARRRRGAAVAEGAGIPEALRVNAPAPVEARLRR
jgi:drug/metabolite transporter (DMT)-like permease